VWIYSLPERTWKKRAPKNVAAEPDYYVTDQAEALLAQLEGTLASVIRDKVGRSYVN